MAGSRLTRFALRFFTGLTLAFIYVPIGVIVLYSFNGSDLVRWPITEFTLDWWRKAFADPGIRSALVTSLQAAFGATAVALVLGTCIAFAVHRFRFFGRESLSFLILLPIALPGIVTGIALNTTFRTAGVDFGLWTVIVGHATFCVVVIYNNVVARLRRVARSSSEASMDLGADSWQTFRRITLPSLGTAVLAGGLLAFALSFDEIIVTTFTSGAGTQTLPIWIFANYSRPNQLPLVNVAAVMVLVLSVIPVYLASRLTSETSTPGSTRT
jgi:putative spermidine/putrescine transport system permease protein